MCYNDSEVIKENVPVFRDVDKCRIYDISDLL